MNVKEEHCRGLRSLLWWLLTVLQDVDRRENWARAPELYFAHFLCLKLFENNSFCSGANWTQGLCISNLFHCWFYNRLFKWKKNKLQVSLLYRSMWRSIFRAGEMVLSIQRIACFLYQWESEFRSLALLIKNKLSTFILACFVIPILRR